MNKLVTLCSVAALAICGYLPMSATAQLECSKIERLAGSVIDARYRDVQPELLRKTIREQMPPVTHDLFIGVVDSGYKEPYFNDPAKQREQSRQFAEAWGVLCRKTGGK